MQTVQLKALMAAISFSAGLNLAAASEGPDLGIRVSALAEHQNRTADLGSAQIDGKLDGSDVITANISGVFKQRPRELGLQRVQFAENCAFEEGTFDTLLGSEWTDNHFEPAKGCRTRSNLSAMISNSKDMVVGRGTRFSDGERAANIVIQYRSGKTGQTKGAGNTAAPAAKTTGE